MRHLLLPLVTLASLASHATGQDTWTRVSSAPGEEVRTLVYDSARNRVVAVGGLDGFGRDLVTSVFDGSNWERQTDIGPVARVEFGLAYDEARGVAVLFGGTDDSVSGRFTYGDTWEWDGFSWSRVATTGPSPRYGASMVFDPVRGQVLLHGGFDVAPRSGMPRNDTWAWDGASWSLVTSNGPAVAFSALTYDTARGRAVLFGGVNSLPLGDTWELDGVNWVFRSSAGPVTGPFFQFSQCQIEYVPSRAQSVLLCGAGPATECWTWDGANWQQLNITAPEVGVFGMAYDSRRDRLVVFGGRSAETWSFESGAWSRVALHPRARYDHAMTYDSQRQRVLVFGGVVGGSTRTWSWDGRTWSLLDSNGPSPSFGLSMAFDPVRDRAILAADRRAWEWDGNGWIQIPSARLGTEPSLVYDSARGEIFAHGNSSWVFRSPAWTMVQSGSGGPGSRFGDAMAYDSVRARTVLFGGRNNGMMRDTWEWDGSVWTQISNTGPAARWNHAMVFDEARGAVVMFGGDDGFGRAFNDTWEWDGVSWTQSVVASGMPARTQHQMAYDAARDRVVVYGGSEVGRPDDNDTWELGPLASIGSSCGGSIGRPVLSSPESRPRINTTFSVELSTLPAGASAWGLLGFGLLAPPVSLDPIGMDGCSLYPTVGYSQMLAPSLGVATWSLPVPNNPSLAGTRFFMQGVVTDASANLFGATTTNAGAATVEL